jgi:tRNA(Ile)-lysidine synthase TilS/MesJ
MSKVLVALSGGVDSAVAALLLKQQGHEVHAAYFRTWMNEEGLPFPGECPWEDDVRNAQAVAEHLGLPFLYLGYWIAQSPKMNYKSRFRPIEQLVGGQWQPLVADRT